MCETGRLGADSQTLAFDVRAVVSLQVPGADVAGGLHPHQHGASGERERRLGLRRLQLHGAQLAGRRQTRHPACQHK